MVCTYVISEEIGVPRRKFNILDVYTKHMRKMRDYLRDGLIRKFNLGNFILSKNFRRFFLNWTCGFRQFKNWPFLSNYAYIFFFKLNFQIFIEKLNCELMFIYFKIVFMEKLFTLSRFKGNVREK